MRSNRNSKTKGFYSDKLAYQTPQLPEPQITSSTFPDKTTPINSQNYNTPFQQTRSYDVTADKIDIQVPGAAPIFGSNTPAQTMNFPQDLADFNASLNNVYADDNFALISTMYRKISLNYMGMDTGIRMNYSDAPDIRTYKAFQYWLRNTAQLVTEISSAMYTDLKIFRWAYGSKSQYRVTGNPGSNDGFMSPWSGYVGLGHGNSPAKLTDISYMLLQYQLEVLYVIILCYSFEQLVTQLPKLQEIYYTKRNYFIYLQNKIKQTRYTAIVKNLLTWLKSRYIDKNFFKDFVLPVLITSKSTDGINSPLVYLLARLNTTYDYLYDATKATAVDKLASASTINTFMLRGLGFTQATITATDAEFLPYVKFNGQNSNALLAKDLNAFSVDTILEKVQSAPTYEEFKTSIDTWLNTAYSLLERTETEGVIFANKPVVIDIETMLSKMATAPKGIQWTTNLEVASLPPLMRYSNWDLVNELVLYQQGPRYTQYTSGGATKHYENGFMQNLPLYKTTGLPRTFMYEYSQAMNGPSNEQYITFFNIDTDLFVRMRDNSFYTLKARTFPDPKTGKEIGCFYLANFSATTMYPLLQSKIAAIFNTSDGTTIGWINPELMVAVSLVYKNKWAEIGQYLNRNYIIPLA